MTIKELMKECKAEIERGNGDREVFISADDEGNSYHKLFYSFMGDESIQACLDMSLVESWGEDIKADKIAILG